MKRFSFLTTVCVTIATSTFCSTHHVGDADKAIHDRYKILGDMFDDPDMGLEGARDLTDKERAEEARASREQAMAVFGIKEVEDEDESSDESPLLAVKEEKSDEAKELKEEISQQSDESFLVADGEEDSTVLEEHDDETLLASNEDESPEEKNTTLPYAPSAEDMRV